MRRFSVSAIHLSCSSEIVDIDKKRTGEQILFTKG